MQNKIFIFKYDNKSNWLNIRAGFTSILNDIIRASTLLDIRQDFEIEIRPISKKRSDQQLRSFWRLVRVIKDYMNDKGNKFTDEEVASWIKISAGHFNEIDGQKIAKSISNKSSATVDDMTKIIEFMLEFGGEHKIKDCYISSAEYDEIINFYK